jgi:hypothetical protein
MTTMTQPLTRRTHVALTGALVIIFWAVAALLVAAAHQLAPPIAALALKIAAVVAISFAYMRLTAPEATLDHALLVGATWLVFGIVAEIVMTTSHPGGWFELLGSPDRPVMRDALLVAWLAAPALFARYRS